MRAGIPQWPRSVPALVLTILVAVIAIASPSWAGDEAPAPDHDGWRFEVVPYLWLPEIHGDVTIRDRSADATVGYSDLFNLLFDGDLFAAMGHFEAHHQKLSLFGDVVGATVNADESGQLARRDVDVKLETDLVLFEFGAAYELMNIDEGRFHLDALGGGRYNHSRTEITVKGEQRGRSADAIADFVDPFFGVRFAVGLIDALSLQVRADVGGFGAGSDLAWSVLGAFRYDTPWKLGSADVGLIAGYKVYDIDYTAGAGDSKRELNLQMRGPAVGIAFTF